MAKIKKGKAGAEDIEFGTDTFERTGKSGTPITLNKVSAVNLPIADAGSKYTGNEIETALQEVLVEDGEGSPAKSYVNKSGGVREAGDVVRIDTDNDEAFELTTLSGDTLVLGVAAEAIGVDESGRILSGGYATAVKVDAACARGSYLKASSTTSKATPSASFEGGTFGIALTSTGGVGTVSAYIFSSGSGGFLPLGGGTLTGEVLSAGRRLGYVAKSASYQTVDTDEFIDVTSGGGGVTITIHSIGIAKSGKRWFIRNADGGAGNVTIATEGSETINGSATQTITSQYDILELVSDGTNLMLNSAVDVFASSNWPSFHVHKDGTSQDNIGTNAVKVTWTSAEFDTNDDFDIVTNSRFLPTVPGKYLLSASIHITGIGASVTLKTSVYKNGALYKRYEKLSDATSEGAPVPAIVVNANGSSDYFEIWMQSGTATADISGTENNTYFSGCRIG